MPFPVETAGEAPSTEWGLSDPQFFSESMLAICPRPELCALTILSLETANPFHNRNHGGIDSEKGHWLLGGKGRTSHPPHRLYDSNGFLVEDVEPFQLVTAEGVVKDTLKATKHLTGESTLTVYKVQLERSRITEPVLLQSISFPELVSNTSFRIFAMHPDRQRKQQRGRKRKRTAGDSDSLEETGTVPPS